MTKLTPLDTRGGQADLTRPKFSPGLLLEDEDLTASVDYTRDLNRLLFRSLFGCGVICGLEVELKADCNKDEKDGVARAMKVLVKPGIGLDCMGNVVHVPTAVTIPFAPKCGQYFPKELWVTACYAETYCRPRDISCGCDGAPNLEAQFTKTRIRAGFEINIWDQ